MYLHNYVLHMSIIFTEAFAAKGFSIEDTLILILDSEFVDCFFVEYLSIAVVAVSFHSLNCLPCFLEGRCSTRSP